MNVKKILIIGGGPAGMMAAIAAGSSSSNVTLLEKNRTLGKKLLLTGNGRCNLTNTLDLENFLAKFSKNGPFLRDSFKHFFNTDLINFFEERGLKCTADPEGRVFPQNNNSSSVLHVLKEELSQKNVTLLLSSPVKKILLENNEIRGVELENGKKISCETVIIATGGLSYPATGSTGDGYKIAERSGHTITPVVPGLVPVVLKEKNISSLMGLSLQGVKIKVSSIKHKFTTHKGDMLFTSKGISGPIVLSTSSTISEFLKEKKYVSISIDQFPEITKEKVDSLLMKLLDKHGTRAIKNSLKELLPQRMTDLFLEISKIDKNKVSGQITKKERHSLSSLFKSFDLTVTKTASMEEAMITRGGVSLKKIDPRTMASRLVKGLFFAGELLDLDGDTGGFNLQEAFSTGYLAGISVSG